MGAVVYDEFPSTPATLVADLIAAITASADWDLLPASYVAGPRTVTAQSNATGTSVASTGANAVGTQIVFGAKLVLGRGTATEEVVVVASVSTNTFTVTAPLVNTHVAGETIEVVYESVVACTAPATAELVVDLDNGFAATTSRIPVAVYRSTAVDKLAGYLRWVNAGSTPTFTMPLHVVVSAGPEHLFISVEGPRPGEPAAEGWTPRQVLFLGTIVPYDDADTSEPLLAIIDPDDSISYGNGVGAYVSRTADDSASWVTADLATVQRMTHPVYGSSSVLSGTYALRSSRGGSRFLWPIIVVEDEDGPRGRLKSVYFVGFQGPTDIPGQRFTYNGLTYIAVGTPQPGGNSSSSNIYYPLGGQAINDSAGAQPLLAVPYSGTPA